MARTVIGVISQIAETFVMGKDKISIVLFERHVSYLMEHLLARCPDKAIAYALNYSASEHPSMFLLDRKGIEHAWRQGEMLALSGLKIAEIIGSEQGRGPETGIRIAESYSEKTGSWVPFRCHPAVNYPVYNYPTLLNYLRETDEDDWDPMVAEWLNSKHPNLIYSDTPETFKGRVMGFLESLLRKDGLRIVTSHFENALLVHSLLVAGVDLGNIPEDWVPTKGGGVLIIKDLRNGKQQTFDYDPNYVIVE